MNCKANIIFGDSRSMKEIENEEVDLIITSPPYWNIKDYEIPKQIGYGQTLHEYLKSLFHVWKECYRVLRKGGRICINIGDQFARAIIYGRYKVIPLHAEIISQCEQIGFDYMGSIIWQKKTTVNTTGGANVMGSFPYPPNGIVEIDYEYIIIFKKPGKKKTVSKEIKEASQLTKEEWKEYFSGHWNFGGIKQKGHEAMFPEELPKRLIKMFTFKGDTVLDPFLGSGTTVKVALELERNSIGYEINENFLEVMKKKLNIGERLFPSFNNVHISKRKDDELDLCNIDYVPRIQDAEPKIDPKKLKLNKDKLYKVIDIIDENTIRLDTGLKVKFLGIKSENKNETKDYLQNYILGKNVFLKFNDSYSIENNTVSAYVYLKNKIFINANLIKLGLAAPNNSLDHKYKEKFSKLWKEKQNA